MDINVLSPLAQFLLPIGGGSYAAWRFWVAREHRASYRTRIEVKSSRAGRPAVLDAIYTVENIGRHMLEIRQVTLTARYAVTDPDSGRLVEGRPLKTASGHPAERIIKPHEEGLVGISPLLPNESASFSLRVPINELPTALFVVGEVEMKGIHRPNEPGRYPSLYLSTADEPESKVSGQLVDHRRRLRITTPATSSRDVDVTRRHCVVPSGAAWVPGPMRIRSDH